MWDDQSLAQVARRRVSHVEVEDVVFAPESLFLDAGEPQGPARLVVLGLTHARRYLAVGLDGPSGGRAWPVTARSMTARERRLYRSSREEA